MESRTFGPTTWVKGDRGRLEPHATDMPKLINLRVHPNGYLALRPPWLETDIVFATADFPQDTSKFIGATFDPGDGALQQGVLGVSPTDIAFYTRDGTLYAYEAGVSTSPSTMTKEAWVSQAEGNLYFFNEWMINLSVEGTNIVPYIRSTDTKVGLLAGIFGGLNSVEVYGNVVHQGRLFLWGGYIETTTEQDPLGSGGGESTTKRTRKNELWYSDAYNYSTFTNNTQFLEFDMDIAGAFSMGSSLFVWGRDGDWWLLQGRGDPDDGTLNYLGKFRIPGINQQPVLMGNRAIFLSSDNLAVVEFDEGGEFVETEYLGLQDEGTRYKASEDNSQIASSSVMDTVFLAGSLSTDTIRHRWNGIWTEEDWSDLPLVNQNADYDLSMSEYDNFELMISRNSTTGNWEAYDRKTSQDELAVPGGSATLRETDMTATLKLPLIADPDRMVRVRRVIMDVKGYQPSGGSDPTATVTADDGGQTVQAFQTGPESTTPNFVEGAAANRTRIEFTPSDMPVWLHRAEVTIDDIRFMAIEQVTVHFELGPNLIESVEE